MADRANVDAIRNLAYQLWQKREPFEGTAEDDWRRAEEMLLNDATLRTGGTPGAREQKKTDQAVKESFPASDPPATHFPDNPPINADAKWAAARAAESDPAPPSAPGRASPRKSPGKAP